MNTVHTYRRLEAAATTRKNSALCKKLRWFDFLKHALLKRTVCYVRRVHMTCN